MIGKVYRVQMPDTASFGWRKWVFVCTPGGGGDGMLSVSQRPLKGGGSELDVYGVEEVQAEHPGCRTFALVNLTDDEQEQPYRCTVGPMTRCSCDAGRMGFRRNSCKHKDAIQDVIVAGGLPVRELVGA